MPTTSFHSRTKAAVAAALVTSSIAAVGGGASAAQLCIPLPVDAVHWWTGEFSCGAPTSAAMSGKPYVGYYIDRKGSSHLHAWPSPDATTNVGEVINGLGASLPDIPPTLQPSFVDGFTVEMWFRAKNGNDDFTLIDALDFGSGGWELSETSVPGAGSGFVRFRLETEPAHDGSPLSVEIVSDTAIIDNTWHHIAVTIDCHQTLRMYVDGAPQAPAVHVPSIRPITNSTCGLNDLTIGYEGCSGFRATPLWLDEVSIYQRELGPAEVQAIANAGTAGKCAPTPLGSAVIGAGSIESNWGPDWRKYYVDFSPQQPTDPLWQGTFDLIQDFSETSCGLSFGVPPWGAQNAVTYQRRIGGTWMDVGVADGFTQDPFRVILHQSPGISIYRSVWVGVRPVDLVGTLALTTTHAESQTEVARATKAVMVP